ncbi:hypothetical protein N9064_00240 [bacterium]|nr:hypothetical protein [bacterium]
MGNVLGINTVTNTVFVRNSGSLLDTLYSVTIFAACNKGALLSNSTNWIVSSAVNSSDSGKLDVTFTYDNSGSSLSISNLSGPISMGLVEGIGAIVDPSNVIVHWTRSNSGAINVASSVETTVSLMYTFANYTFNNNIKFTSNNYIVNYDKTCPQEYSPVKSIISSTVTENGHNIVVIGSVTVGPGVWYIVCSGGFELINKKYFFLADKIVSDFSSDLEYHEYLRDDAEIMSSFGTYQIASAGNVYPVNTSMVYTGTGSSNVVRWCFTCELIGASSIIFDDTVTSGNTDVHGRPNNLVMCAIKISS